MRIIVAPDSFKGSASAVAVADAVGRGIRRVFPEAEICQVPIADGGEGTVEAMVAATGGKIMETLVKDPLGRDVTAAWGILGDQKTAVIEMAAASGLPLLKKEERNPLKTSTYGTGQLIQAALDAGVQRIVIGIGGSATNDGGAGMARALGVRFLTTDGSEIAEGGGALSELAQIDLSGRDPRLQTTEILTACDVDNPLCGAHGASAVYGPQKGATPELVQVLDAALANFGRIAEAATGRKVMLTAGAGAAGGLGAGLLSFTEASLHPGIEVVLETVGFEQMLDGADLVITGEGNTDFQTACGKAPVGVARLARQADVPVLCLSGGLGKGADEVLEHGIDALMSILPRPMELEDCMAQSELLIEEAAVRMLRLVKTGMQMGKRV